MLFVVLGVEARYFRDRFGPELPTQLTIPGSISVVQPKGWGFDYALQKYDQGNEQLQEIAEIQERRFYCTANLQHILKIRIQAT